MSNLSFFFLGNNYAVIFSFLLRNDFFLNKISANVVKVLEINSIKIDKIPNKELGIFGSTRKRNLAFYEKDSKLLFRGKFCRANIFFSRG